MKNNATNVYMHNRVAERFFSFSKCVTLHYIGTTDFEISSFHVALKVNSHLFLFVLFIGVHQLGQSLFGTSQIEEESHRFGSRLP